MSGPSATRSGAGWSPSSPDQIAYVDLSTAKAERTFMPSVFPAIRADSIAELAAKLGLDPAALEARS